MLDITETEYGLLLEIRSAEDRADLRERHEDKLFERVIWGELFEPYFTNGSYTPVTPEDIGALTSDPYLIADYVDIEDDGTVVPRGDIYHCPDYAVICVIEELIEHGQYELRRL